MDELARNKLYSLISDALGIEATELTAEAEFIADLNSTPEEVAELVKKVEDSYQVEIETEPENIVTVSDLVQALEEAEL